jgi:all-trans-retinol 13,14-reductase
MKGENKHAIIIGSGLGGLVCGYILAKNGLRVTVLEKNRQAGGCLQTFTRNGAKFETGMHYIGSMKKQQLLYNYFDYLSLIKDIRLSQLDESGFDIISLKDNRYPIATGDDAFIETLSRFFPNEHSNLVDYRTNVHNIVSTSPFCSFNFDNLSSLYSPSDFDISASHFLEQTTTNTILQNVLAGNNFLYAGVYDKTPLYIYSLIQEFYNNSAFRIIGGSDSITRSLISSIQKMGGKVYTNSKVVEIKCNNHSATTAVLSTGECIEGDYFISDLHPARSIELLSTPLIKKVYRKRISNLQNTISNFTVYLQFKQNTIPYINSNFYHYNCDSVWNGEKYNEEEWPMNFVYMHICNKENQQYADTAILLAYMKYEEVQRWEDSVSGNRGTDYLEFKERKAERLIDELEKQMPGTKQNILHYYTSSPLTYRDYTGTEQGSMYGILHDYADPYSSLVLSKTNIPNVFFCGQNTNAHGILGVIIGCFITCAEIVGIQTLVGQLEKIKEQ